MRPPKGKFTLLARYTHESRRHRSAVELRRYQGRTFFEVEVLPDGKESAREVSETYARASIRLRTSEGPSHRYVTPKGEAFLAEKSDDELGDSQERPKRARTTRRRKTDG